jgi:predicted Zn-dependent protease
MRHSNLLSVALAVLALVAATPAAGQQEPVPRPLADDLAQARDMLEQGRPAEAAALLERYEGPDHIVRWLLAGQAYSEAEKPEAAEQAFQRALELDPDRRDAHKGLARAHMDQQEWQAARRSLARGVQIRTDTAEWLLAYADVSRRLEDSRLTRIIVDAGISRFPEDLRFRRLDLELLLNGASPRAVEAARQLVRRDPGSAQAWQWLARALRQADQPASARAALQAALLSGTAPPETQHRYLQQRLAAGDWLTVLERAEALLQGGEAQKARQQPELMELFIAAAERGGRDERLAQWIEDVPEEARTPYMRAALARLHLRRGQPEDAFQQLTRLIEQGDANVSSYMTAAYAASELGKLEQAQTLYREAEALGGPAARMAPLRRARIYQDQGHPDRARSLVRDYLAQHPTDTAARAYLRLLEQAQPEQ